MSWQAQTAVNHHSKINDMKLFRLLLYLADCANENGRIDPSPSQDTLAEFYRVSTRTIRTWLTKLCNTGELEQVRVGSGPGNPSAFQICLPIEGEGGRKAEEIPIDFSAFESFVAEIKAEIDGLKVEISSLKAEKVEAKGGKGGSERRKGHSFKSADDPSIDPSFDPEKDNNPPVVPPSPETIPFIPVSNSSRSPKGPADKRVDAILRVCGMRREVQTHLRQAEKAAVELNSFSAGAILDRYQHKDNPNGTWYWYRDDWRGAKGQQPKPKDIVETISLRRVKSGKINAASGRSTAADSYAEVFGS